MNEKHPPLDSLKFSLQLSQLLGENEPMQKFHLWSAVTIVSQPVALEMYNYAIEEYQASDSRSLGSYWYDGITSQQNGLSQRIRRNVRQIMNLEPHSVPDCFR